MTTADMPVVRLTNPGDIVAAVPVLCGFVPTESLVLISLKGERRRIGLTLRLDLASPAMDTFVASEMASRLKHDDAASTIIVVFTDERGDLPRASMVHDITRTLSSSGINTMEAIVVRDGRWFSYTCTSSCCPPEGTPVHDPMPLLAASAVFDGRAVLKDRAELTASVAAPTVTADEEARFDSAAIGWLNLLDQGDKTSVRRRALDDLRTAMTSGVVTDVAELVAPLQDVMVRDVVATWALEEAEALLTLLLSLARQVPAPYDPPVCTLVAVTAWVRGDGAIANVALDRALATNPSYSMAQLLRTGLDGQLPPSTVKEWLTSCRVTLQDEGLL